MNPMPAEELTQEIDRLMLQAENMAQDGRRMIQIASLLLDEAQVRIDEVERWQSSPERQNT
jgi:hypothetical protein